MIDVYFWPTPNGHKISIFLEETGQPYRLIPVNIGKGEQFKPDFLAIAPNNKIPAIVDHEPSDGEEPLALFESGAILNYLAGKTGQLLPATPREHWQVIQWLSWQIAGLGPMLGQLFHFLNRDDKIPAAIERYSEETRRLYTVLDKQLAGRDYIAGDYSIADIASWPWARYHKELGIDLTDLPNVRAWLDRVGNREAVKRALEKGNRAKKS